MEPAISAGEAAPYAGILMDSEPEQDTDTDADTRTGGGEQPAVREDIDALSDITDSSDLEHAAVNAEAGWQTYADQKHIKAKTLPARMRQYPLMPCDPSDGTGYEGHRDMESCVQLPRLHCAIKTC